jgi:acetyl esterase/lipase
MPSPELEEIKDRYRWYRAAVDELASRSQADGTPFGIDDYRKLDFFTLTAEPRRVNFTHVDAGGVPAIWAQPADIDTDRVIVYFHGGAYAQSSAAQYRSFCGQIANTVG